MKVRLLVSRVGDGFSQDAGQVIDVSTDDAKALLDGGYAERVDGIETAMAQPREAAMRQPGKARRA